MLLFLAVQTPLVDMSLKLIKGVDLMALPGIKDAVNYGLKVGNAHAN